MPKEKTTRKTTKRGAEGKRKKGKLISYTDATPNNS
jgi:hypothetical protein